MAQNKGDKPTGGDRVALYYREPCGREEWDERSEIMSEVGAMERAAKARDLSIFAHWTDHGSGIPLAERPGFYSLYGQVKAGIVSAMIVPSLARLTRKADELLTILAIIELHGARLIVLEEGVDTASPLGRLWMLSMIESKSPEVDQLKQMVKDGRI